MKKRGLSCKNCLNVLGAFAPPSPTPSNKSKYCNGQELELKKSNAPAAIGVLVVHNKLKPKKGTLPADVTYIAGEHVPNAWNCYPWDAKAYGRDIYAHEELARQCAGEKQLAGGWMKLALAAAAGGALAAVVILRAGK